MNTNEQRRSSGAGRAVALVVGLAVVAACGTVTPAATVPAGTDGIAAVNARGGDVPAEGTPRSGGTLVMGTDREAIGFDPSLSSDDILGTIPQSLFLMNNPQVHRAIRAGQGTMLGELLVSDYSRRGFFDGTISGGTCGR